MNMRIVTTQSAESFEHIAYIECFATTGNITILPGHEPTTIALKPGSQIIIHYESGEIVEKVTHNALLDIERHTLVCIEE